MKLCELIGTMKDLPMPYRPVIKLYKDNKYVCEMKPDSEVVQMYANHDVQHVAPKFRDVLYINLKK